MTNEEYKVIGDALRDAYVIADDLDQDEIHKPHYKGVTMVLAALLVHLKKNNDTFKVDVFFQYATGSYDFSEEQ